MDTLMNEIQKLKETQKEKDECISQMQAQINRLEQRLLINTIEIKNIPPSQNENLIDLVKAIGKTIKQEVTNTDISDFYRTRPKNPKRSSIVATFNNTLIKNTFVSNARVSRPVTIAKINQNSTKITETNNNNIFINDMLTNRPRAHSNFWV